MQSPNKWPSNHTISMEVAQVLKSVLVFVCLLWYPHMAAFFLIIVLSSVCCALGADVLFQLCLLFGNSFVFGPEGSRYRRSQTCVPKDQKSTG